MNWPNRTIGDMDAGRIGFGCMTLSHAYGVPPARQDGKKILNEALDLGYRHLDSAALYGFGANETLIGEALSHRRDEFILASKCALQPVDGKRVLTNDPAKLRQSCEDSLRRLQTEVIDLFYLHRYDKVTPLEDSVGALADLVQAGKVRMIGLSEVSADTLRRAHAVHPISAVQSEYSLWTREPEIAVLETCQEIGATFVAFSPLARGFLTGKLRDINGLPDNDLRRNMPRFFPENYGENLKLVDELRILADASGCTVGQLALCWLLSRGDHILPIPGTIQSAHLQENIAAEACSPGVDVLAAAGDIINQHTVAGARYVPATLAEIDTEQFESD